MVATLDFVVRVAQRAVVAIVDGAADGQAALQQLGVVLPFVDHVSGGLPLEPAHALIKVLVLPMLLLAGRDRLFGPRAHDQARIARLGVPAAFRKPFAEGPHVGDEVVPPQRTQRGVLFLAIEQPPQANPMGPGLPKDLVDITARSHPDRLGVAGIFLLKEILAVEQGQHLFSAGLGNSLALPGEHFVAHLPGHHGTCPQGGQVQRTGKADLAEPGGVQRVPLSAVQNAIPIGIAGNDKLDRLLHSRPQAAKPLVVNRHLVLAQDPQNPPALAVVSVF